MAHADETCDLRKWKSPVLTSQNRTLGEGKKRERKILSFLSNLLYYYETALIKI